MQEQSNIIDCYNKTAKSYAEKFVDELKGKHLDRILLNSFANENNDKGKLVDLGCGPGQTTRYLWDHGLTNLLGVDISPSMVKAAKALNPDLSFETADMLDLQQADATFGSAVAFYSIVHFDYEQVALALKEIKRVLTNDAQFLFSFHAGDNIIHLDTFLDHAVNIDFHFFDVNTIINLLTVTGFRIIDAIERQPYAGVEFPSKRAYIWTQKI